MTERREERGERDVMKVKPPSGGSASPAPAAQLVLSPATAHTSLGNVNKRSRSEGNTNPSRSKLVSLDNPAELSSS